MAIVKRSYDADMELRASSGEGSLSVRGHAAVYDQRTVIGRAEPGYGFVEVIQRGAFDDVLGDDVRYLENHDGLPFARTKNGTLRLSLDQTGLLSDADLNPGMQRARDHHAAIERGDIDQMSFAFTIEGDEVRELDKDDEFAGMVQRTITKVGRLYDVSGVTYPAYEGADIGVRSMDASETEIRSVLDRIEIPELDVEARDAGSEDQEIPVPEKSEDAMSPAEARLRNRLRLRQNNKEIQ